MYVSPWPKATLGPSFCSSSMLVQGPHPRTVMVSAGNSIRVDFAIARLKPSMLAWSSYSTFSGRLDDETDHREHGAADGVARQGEPGPRPGLDRQNRERDPRGAPGHADRRAR